MREIKFRGWDSTGQKGWVTGDLVHAKGISKDSDEDLFDRIMVGGYEVVPESVGQLTGLNDITGREIYEGDVVRYDDVLSDDNEVIETVVFEDGCFWPVSESWATNIEVIGTVYEQNNK